MFKELRNAGFNIIFLSFFMKMDNQVASYVNQYRVQLNLDLGKGRPNTLGFVSATTKF